jgi:hypothetical protein
MNQVVISQKQIIATPLPLHTHTHTHTHTLELYTSKTNYLIYVYQNKEKQLFEPCDIILSIPDKRRMNHYLYNNIVLSMLYAGICPKVRRHNARPEEGECIMPSNLGTYFGI